MTLTKNFFEEVYIEAIAFNCFYGELKKLTEQTEKEIINIFKDNLNIDDTARKITRAGLILAEFENKGTDFIIKKRLPEVLIIRRLIDYNYNLIKTNKTKAIPETDLLSAITDFLCGRDVFYRKVVPEYNKRKNKNPELTDLHSYVINVCDYYLYYSEDGTKAANGYVTRKERDDKYKLVERVYNQILEKRKEKCT